MKKKTVLICVLPAMLLLTTALAAACSGRTTMLMGRWKLATYGNADGGNQQDYPLPLSLDVYPDGHIDMLDSAFGTYTVDRDSFTFKSDDGTITASGQFQLEYPNLTVYMDDSPTSYVLNKVMDLPALQSAKASAAASAKASAAAPATPTPEATATAK